MPEIKKQKPPPSARPQTMTRTKIASNASVLDRIAPVQDASATNIKMSIYGVPKTGKTRFACTFPKPLLIIGTEDGTKSVAGMKGVDFVQLNRADEFLTLIRGPVLQGRWKTVVLDTATKLRDLLVAEAVMGVDPQTGAVIIPASRPSARLYKDAYMNAASELKSMLRALLDLPRVIDLNVIIIAQEANLESEDSASPTSEVLKPKIASMVGKAVAYFINAECDYIAQTLIREEVEEVEQAIPAVGNEPAGTVKVMQRTGKKEYAMRIGPHETFVTGFRLAEGRALKQEFIVDPSYDKIVQLIEGSDNV